MEIYKKVLNKNILALTIAVSLLSSCGGGKKDEGKDEIVETVDTVKTSVVNVGGELFSVPSPIQTALLIQKSGITYDKSI